MCSPIVGARWRMPPAVTVIRSGTADVFVNTSHDYEPFLYAAVITGLLEQIEDAGENRETVERLLESYRHFFPIGAELIPQGSLIREFIGEDGE